MPAIASSNVGENIFLSYWVIPSAPLVIFLSFCFYLVILNYSAAASQYNTHIIENDLCLLSFPSWDQSSYFANNIAAKLSKVVVLLV